MKPLSRRTVLRGLGTALALPWLEAMASAGGRAPGAPAPLRLAYVYVPNGVHMPDWTPAEEGELAGELPWILRPLAAHRADLLVLSGLTHDKGRANGDGPGDHARACATFLTGAQPFKGDGSRLEVGVSADQLAASRIGHRTRFPSLELGCEPGRLAGQCDSGYPCAYSSNLSWTSPLTPATKETRPRLAFDRLFLDGRPGESAERRLERLRRRDSILDLVRDDARRLADRLGAADRRKVDEYLHAVRELERRVQHLTERGGSAVPEDERPDEPADFAAHVRVMLDLLVLAFRTDSTRIATLLLANEGSNRSYRDLGIADGHHSLSHHGKDPAKQDQIRRINRHHAEHLAYLLERMKAVEEEDGTLLDHAMVVYGSGIGDGNRHNHDDLPLLVAGRGHGSLRTGRHVRYPRETPACDLHLALLARLGLEGVSLGDGRGPLDGLG